MIQRSTVLKIVIMLAISDIHCQYIRPIQDRWPWISYTSSTSGPSTETTTTRRTTPSPVDTSTVASRLGTPTPGKEATFSPDLDLDENYVRVTDMKTNREYWIPRDRFWSMFGNRGKAPRSLDPSKSGSRSKRGAYSSGYYSHNHVQQTGSLGSSAYTGRAGSQCKDKGRCYYILYYPISRGRCTYIDCQNMRKGHTCGSHWHKTPHTGPATLRPQYPRTTTNGYFYPSEPGTTPGTRRPTTGYPTKWIPTTESSTEKSTKSVPKTPTIITEPTSTTSIPTSRVSTTTLAPPTIQTTDDYYVEEYEDENVTPAR